jgi:LPS-assembly lipoprotein
MKPIYLTLTLAACLFVAGCGFHLRGQSSLPFDTLYIEAAETSGFAADLKRSIRYGSQTKLVDSHESAQAVLHILSEIKEKKILSLNSAGRVREFELYYRVLFKVTDQNKNNLIPATEIFMKRDFTFNDAQVLAKESEEALLYRDMQNDAVQQMMRRLNAIKASAS